MITSIVLSLVIAGCGGGGGAAGTSDGSGPIGRTAAAYAPSQMRSVRLNNYNNWSMNASEPADESRVLDMLAMRENVCLTEFGNRKDITAQTIKAISPSTKVYRIYDLCIKNNWDPDWSNPSDTTKMQTPLSKATIDKNNWWLRDGDGNIVKDTEGTGWYLDVGKPGFKEAYSKAIIVRNAGQGYDGIVFDYWCPDLRSILGSASRPASYSADDDWYNKAWKPFITHISSELHAARYRIIGNCAGQLGDGRAMQQWQRTQIDGTIYEQWAVDWDGKWLSGSVVERRINDFASDPLEVWSADYGLRNNDNTYDQKVAVGLAMYYVAVPVSQQNRSYHHYRDNKVYWEPLWNFYIGQPTGSVEKRPGKYFWSRKFTEGLVLLNYESSETIRYTLDRTYHDYKGSNYSGNVEVPPHTALILAATE